MNVSRKQVLEYAVAFARVCESLDLEPLDLSKIVTLAIDRTKAACRLSSAGSDETVQFYRKRQQRLEERLDALAADHGFKVEYSSVFATLVRNGVRTHIPIGPLE